MNKKLRGCKKDIMWIEDGQGNIIKLVGGKVANDSRREVKETSTLAEATHNTE